MHLHGVVFIHLDHGVKLLLEMIHKFGPTIRTKMFVATIVVAFLGYVIKEGQIMPELSLIDNIFTIK